MSLFGSDQFVSYEVHIQVHVYNALTIGIMFHCDLHRCFTPTATFRFYGENIYAFQNISTAMQTFVVIIGNLNINKLREATVMGSLQHKDQIMVKMLSD